MSFNRSRSPPRGKRFRSIERISYRDAPYSRDRRSYRSLEGRIFIPMSEYVSDTGVGYGYFKKNEESKQHSLILPRRLILDHDHLPFMSAPCFSDNHLGEWRQDYLCNKCKRPGHFARECPNMTVCNNCGLPGHIAAECNSTTMCWNCKEPGHFASQCPNEPVCHMCGKMGHLARDCLNPGLQAHDARLCNNCYKPGHIAADCSNEKACNNCRKTGHLARDCPNEPVCNICNISGHLARQCTKSSSLSSDIGGSGSFRDIICRNCGQPGHISRDCVSIVICNNCGGRGHLHSECPSASLYERPECT